MKPEVIEPEVIEPEVIEPEVENNSTSPQLEGNPELQLALSQASNLTSLISEAKTTAKRDLYKRKMQKLRKKIQIMLYTQYFQNKALNTK